MRRAAMDVVAFVRLGRPLFLVGGFVLYGLGAAIAARGSAIDGRRYALGQLVVTAFQLMTHYANDYFDYDADRANLTPTAWSGGSRVLVAGELPRAVALVAALVLASAGTALALVLAAAPGAGRLVLPAAGAMLALSWEYSAPPLRLCARGAGELVTALVVTGLVPWFAYYLQAHGGDGRVLLASIAPLACLQAAMLIAIEFPDAAGDATAAKRTLVVRLGAASAARLYVGLVAVAYLALVLGALTVLPARVALAGAASLPIAAWRCARIAEHRDPAAWERLGFWAVAVLIATAVAKLAATITLRWA